MIIKNMSIQIVVNINIQSFKPEKNPTIPVKLIPETRIIYIIFTFETRLSGIVFAERRLREKRISEKRSIKTNDEKYPMKLELKNTNIVKPAITKKELYIIVKLSFLNSFM